MSGKSGKSGKKIIKRKRKLVEDDGGRAKLAEQLKARYGKKREDEVTVAYIDADTMEIVQPSSYNRQISRVTDSHLNRLLQPEQPENFVSSSWICAICQHGSCHATLGELYGPYYVRVREFAIPPPKILIASQHSAKTKSSTESDPSGVTQTDLWMHGDCAVWAPDLHLIGGRFPALARHMSKYWKQKCKVCQKVGASIPISRAKNLHAEFLHYPCAVEKGYRLDEFTFKCHPSCASKNDPLIFN